MEEVDDAESLRMIARAVSTARHASRVGPPTLPVNFVADGAIMFRTTRHTRRGPAAGSPAAQVSFEADCLHEALREGWSVLVQGRAHKVTGEREIEQLQNRTHLEPWAAGARDVYIRITPTRISGRRIQPS